MSVIINMEDFQDWSEIFMEIERQRNLRVFTAIEPGTSQIRRGEKKPRSPSAKEREPTELYKQMGESEGKVNSNQLTIPQRHVRSNSTPCSVIDTKELHRDSRLTDAALKLNDEQMMLLYEDILKPLDVYSILREQRKQMSLS